jgi:hypothetical protein
LRSSPRGTSLLVATAAALSIAAAEATIVYDARDRDAVPAGVVEPGSLGAAEVKLVLSHVSPGYVPAPAACTAKDEPTPAP